MELTREIMGVFALGVLWLNTSLVSLAALSRAVRLGRLHRKLSPLAAGEATGYGLVRSRPAPGGAGSTPKCCTSNASRVIAGRAAAR